MNDPVVMIALLLWGMLAGIDLVSFPQAMLGRPLVASTFAGLLLGDIATGLRIGILLECYALDVLPVGAARYPDYGPAAVTAVFAATLIPGTELTGLPVLLGLVIALVGGHGMELQRRFNGRLVARAAPALAEGDARVLARLQGLGLLADAFRSLITTALGLGLAALVTPRIAPLNADPSLTLVAVAGAILAAFSGALRRAATGVPRVLLAAGLTLGAVMVWLV